MDDGKQRWNGASQSNISRILLDVQKRAMDCMKACKQIVKNDPESIVIFVTAHALDEFKAQAVAIGAKSFISKPFRLSDIQKVLDVLDLEWNRTRKCTATIYDGHQLAMFESQ